MAELDGRLEARAKRDDLPVAGGPVASAPCAGARRPDDCSLQDHGGIADERGQCERVVTYSLHSHKRGSHLSGKAPCHANLPPPGATRDKSHRTEPAGRRSGRHCSDANTGPAAGNVDGEQIAGPSRCPGAAPPGSPPDGSIAILHGKCRRHTDLSRALVMMWSAVTIA